jgi:hypothetical protein
MICLMLVGGSAVVHLGYRPATVEWNSHLHMVTSVLPMQAHGFGVLVPSTEAQRHAGYDATSRWSLDGLLGVTMDSVTFPNQAWPRRQRHNNDSSTADDERGSEDESHGEAETGLDDGSPHYADVFGKRATRLTFFFGDARFPQATAGLTSESDLTEWSARAMAVAHRVLGVGALPEVIHAHLARDGILQPTVGHGERVARLLSAMGDVGFGRLHVGGMVHGVSVPDCIATSARLATEYALKWDPTAVDVMEVGKPKKAMDL